MSVLGNPIGNLLSQTMYSSYGRTNYSAVEYVDVTTNFLGFVTDGITTYVRINTSGYTNAMYGSPSSSANTIVYFAYSDNIGNKTVSSYSVSGFGNIIIYNTSYKTKLESIRVYSNLSCTGSTSGFGYQITATTTLDKTITISQCNSQTVLVNSTSTISGEDNYAKHICLPIGIPQGYSMRIKNVSKDYLYVHALSNKIEDGAHSRIFVSTTVNSITGNECGFIMPKNAACTLLYDGTAWLINEYYSGQRSGYFNTMNYDLGIDPATKSIINQPVVIADITSASKYICLPNPAGSIRQVTLISYGSSTNLLYFTAGAAGRTIDGISYDTINYRWWGLRPDKSQANAAATLLSDGSNWYVMSCTDAVDLWWDSNQDDRPTISATHTTVSKSTRTDAITTDGVSLTQANVPASGATIYYIKHGGLCAYGNGIVVTTARDGAFIGGTKSKRAYLGYQRNRSAAAVLATNVGSQPMFFLLSSFIGL